MKIRLVIVDSDENYAKRLLSNLQVNYADKVEVYYFSAVENVRDFLMSNHVHVILADAQSEFDKTMIPERTSFAYLVPTNDVEELQGMPAVCKFQKVDLLYKNVLSLFADMEKDMVVRSGQGNNHIVLFTSAQGGVGTSALAAAFAMNKASKGARVLYLSLDKMHRTESCFTGEGNMSFSDVLYAIKSKRANLSIKLESIIKKDSTGVDFFDSAKNANDMLDINAEDMELLLKALGTMDNYDYIVMDAALDFSPVCKLILQDFAKDVIVVDDGSEVGNVKFQRALEVLELMEQGKKGSILSKCRIIYNRFSSSTGQKIVDLPVETAGGINRIEGASYSQLIKELSVHSVIGEL